MHGDSTDLHDGNAADAEIGVDEQLDGLIREAMEYEQASSPLGSGCTFELQHPDLAQVIHLLRSGSVFSVDNEAAAQPMSHAQSADITTWHSGLTIGRLQIREVIGSGSFGTVYRATDSVMSRDVAIKTPHRDGLSPQLASRFAREVRAAARLNHPSIVRVFEAGEFNGIPYMVSEFVPGRTLTSLLRSKGPLFPADAALLLRRLAEGVHHAHQQGIVHRDIKPDNILLTPTVAATAESESVDITRLALAELTPRLTDFGLARILDDDLHRSHAGGFVGTPRYMAPEQLRSEPGHDPRAADIYSLGVLLHEMLTGTVPHSDLQTVTSLAAAGHLLPTSLRRFRSQIPRDLDAICLKCLHPDPRQRYDSAEQLAQDLACWQQNLPTRARPLSSFESLSRWVQAHRQIALLTAVVAISLLLMVLTAITGQYRVSRTNQQLFTANELLRRQQLETRRQQNFLEQERSIAVQREADFRRLAWNSGIRDAFAAWNRQDLISASASLKQLRLSDNHAIQHTEWQLLNHELGQQFRQLLSIPQALYEVRAIPGTEFVAVAGETSEIQIVDTRSGRLLQTIDSGIGAVHALAISPDGRRLAAGGIVNPKTDRSRAAVFELQTGDLIQELPEQLTTIESLEFSSDGTHLMSAARYENPLIVDLLSNVACELSAQSRHRWLSSGPADRYAASADGDFPAIRLINLQSDGASTHIAFPQPTQQIWWAPVRHNLIGVLMTAGGHVHLALSEISHPEPVVCCSFAGVESASLLRFSNDGRLLFGIEKQGEIVCWQMPDQIDVQRTYQIGRRQSPEGSTTAEVAAQTQQLAPPLVFSPASQQIPPLARWRVAEFPITSLDIAKNMAVVTTWGGDLTAVDVSSVLKLNGRLNHEQTGEPPCTAVAVSENLVLQAVSGDGIRIGALPDTSKMPSHSATAQPLAGEAEADGHIVRMLETHRPALRSLSESMGGAVISRLAVSPDRQMLACVLNESTVILMRKESFLLLNPPSTPMHHDVPVFCVAFSPDSSQLAWSGNRRIFLLRDTRTSADTPDQFPIDAVQLPGTTLCFTWSPVGDSLLIGGTYERIYLIRCETSDTSGGDLPAPVPVALPGVNTEAMVIRSDSEMIFTGHNDGVIRAWDRNFRRIRSLNCHPSAVQTITLDPSERTGVSVDIHGNVAVWFADTGEPIGGLVSLVNAKDFEAYQTRLPIFAPDGSALHVFYTQHPLQLRSKTWSLKSGGP